ncbi:hypothetical protein [Roseococcus suduntuyensis]|uniref:Uncharacterized protein n=1 Tax=Roseococcus suduntuyensis TaxID=455361 RepID=A0A840AHZ6_9PROT|nr:hypothetical protein [Roseococcus suduntuyensis]MBB3900110.1 hypothetical protein [Roseococcus suduntuyensis]
MHPETRNGANQHTRVGQIGQAFADDTAEKTGVAARTIRRDATRGERLVEEKVAHGGPPLPGGHIDEWRRLTVEKVGAACTHLGGVQPAERGIKKTADALGVSEDTVKRATRIAALPQDVRDTARAEDWSQSRLLQAARPTPKAPPIAPDPLEEEQAIEAQVKRLMAAWNAAGPDARAANGLARMFSSRCAGPSWTMAWCWIGWRRRKRFLTQLILTELGWAPGDHRQLLRRELQQLSAERKTALFGMPCRSQ